MWEPGELAELTGHTVNGFVRWQRSPNGREATAEWEGRTLTLRRDDDGQITLTVVPDGSTTEDVIADSKLPELEEPLRRLWNAVT